MRSCLTLLNRIVFLTLFVGRGEPEFVPLTSIFTPAPECSSLTIVHVQRSVAIFTGCVGQDPSCCPQTRHVNNTYSPGICPTGYETYDAHVGLDELAVDTEEWEATCIPSAVQTCTMPVWIFPHVPIRRFCPGDYYSLLPTLTTPITASVFYYPKSHPSSIVYPGIPAFRTTTVISGSWPTLTPASTTPTKIFASHLVIRWRDSDFTSGVTPRPVSSISSGFSSVHSMTSIQQSSPPKSSKATADDGAASSLPTSVGTEPTHPKALSTTGLIAAVISSVVAVSGIVLALMYCHSRFRNKRSGGSIELDDDLKPVGCKVLYEDPIVTQPEVDIVFVHGLRGHRMRTWDKDGYCWPKDLVPRKLPGARVITFGYDASVTRFFGRSSTNNINKHAESLLFDLYDLRNDGVYHPIIFIAHSLGGLVVKDALKKARELTDYQSIFQATRGIIFLGTPHHGSGFANLGTQVARVIRVINRDTNVGLLRSIEVDSEILERISQDFLITRERGNIQVCSFVEELAMSYMLDPVVPARFGYMGIDGEIRRTIHANHRDMCRFKDANAPGLERIMHRLVDFVAAAVTNRQDLDALIPDLPTASLQRGANGAYWT